MSGKTIMLDIFNYFLFLGIIVNIAVNILTERRKK